MDRSTTKAHELMNKMLRLGSQDVGGMRFLVCEAADTLVRLETERDEYKKKFEWWDKVIRRIVDAAYDGNVAMDEWSVDELVSDVSGAYEARLERENEERILDKQMENDDRALNAKLWNLGEEE